MNDPLSSQPTAPGEDSPQPEAPHPFAESAATAIAATEAALPEDLRAPWDFVDMVIFLFLAIGSLLILNTVLATMALSFAFVKPEAIDQFVMTNAGFIVLRQIVWFGLLLTYLYTMVHLRSDAPAWRTLGWRGLPRRATTVEGRELPKSWVRVLGQIAALLTGGALLAFFVQLATLFVGTRAKLPIQALLNDRRNILYMMGFGLAVAPIAEETIFRGFLYPVLARRFGVIAGVVFTGMFFGLMHAEQLWGGWGEIGLLVMVGIVFTAARARSGSVAVSYLLHLGYNGLLFLGTYVATGGLRHF